MRRTSLTWVALFLALAAAAGAQNLYIETHPGYADLGLFEDTLGDHVTFDLALDRTQLGALLALARPGDEHLMELVNEVEGVRAKVFAVEPEQLAAIREGFAAAADGLKDRGWSTLVSVVDDEEQVKLLLLTNEKRIQGVAALFVSDDEAGFANLVGDIDAAQVFSQLPNVGAVREFVREMKDRGEVNDG